MTRPEIGGISPFFIVQDAAGAPSFYRDRLELALTITIEGEKVAGYEMGAEPNRLKNSTWPFLMSDAHLRMKTSGVLD